jgi:hypothetical protein
VPPGITGLGHTYEGGYIGFQLHLVSNRCWQITAFDISAANRHDLDPVKSGFLEGLPGALLTGSATPGLKYGKIGWRKISLSSPRQPRRWWKFVGISIRIGPSFT